MASDFSELRKLRTDLRRKQRTFVRRTSTAVRKTALAIEADGQIFAPVETGALMNSIGSDIAPLWAEIGPTVDYGHYVEDGTSRMAPQPYMGPAADRRFPQFEKALEQIASDVL